ncbi:Mob1/phocein family protein [Toxoplasma gondii GAB2-2007-GAL-DOM2]|uniref:Mob1/phocein family domain-containing protein n=8 Tax=Toxoplasma gondii TaxID=5811 RepID=B9QR16_TOXGV|nr:Mob1/phocein family protein [Toxoplasma gondii VEG]KFG32209.1 Mob1/phocein family protein [Toxoplasma gondii GAB2-2007-GAL-DOM2]KFG33975.1 Mob1/phocein family protein [Toxoplasma gondii p89]KFH00573.1 Mob1/phocein family protein [Toxoplasma gondii VAND]KFH08066.1 Mob1/phocein family protein [Toxoplasma gondii MAS]RQX72915.1 Mob1/phocein family protein [Toxoplasma gondii CAST]
MNYWTSWRLPRPCARKAPLQGGAAIRPKKASHARGESERDESETATSISSEAFLTHPPRWAMTLTAARASLGNQVLPLAVKMPATCVDLNEWLAVKTFDVFNEVQLVWSLVKDQCQCRGFTAGEHTLPSVDGDTSHTAKEHVRLICIQLRSILQDSKIFVIEPGAAFPDDFSQHVSFILAQLMHIYCHIYRQHFEYLVETDTVAYVNCCFKHALLFGNEFHLITDADVAAVANLVKIFLKQAQSEQHRSCTATNWTSLEGCGSGRDRDPKCSLSPYHSNCMREKEELLVPESQTTTSADGRSDKSPRSSQASF